MYSKKLILILMILYGAIHAGLMAQNAIPASGGDASGNLGTASYTLGQVFYTAGSGTGGIITLGVQQPYVILSLEANQQKSAKISLACLAYPNPTSDLLVLKLDENFELTKNNLSFRLFDENGRLLSQQRIIDYTTRFSLKSYSSSVYHLQVISPTQSLITFKIIKN